MPVLPRRNMKMLSRDSQAPYIKFVGYWQPAVFVDSRVMVARPALRTMQVFCAFTMTALRCECRGSLYQGPAGPRSHPPLVICASIHRISTTFHHERTQLCSLLVQIRLPQHLSTMLVLLVQILTVDDVVAIPRVCRLLGVVYCQLFCEIFPGDPDSRASAA